MTRKDARFDHVKPISRMDMSEEDRGNLDRMIAEMRAAAAAPQSEESAKLQARYYPDQPLPKQAMKASHGKAMLHLLPPAGLIEIARVREFGARKYEPWDWTAGRNWTEYYDAMLRHLFAWHVGQDNDPESGLNHIAHVGCNALFLLEFARSGKGLDNRPSGLLVDIASEKR